MNSSLTNNSLNSKLPRKRAPQFDLPSWVNVASACAVHVHEISSFSSTKKVSINSTPVNGVLNQRFKTLILPSQIEHKSLEDYFVWNHQYFWEICNNMKLTWTSNSFGHLIKLWFNHQNYKFFAFSHQMFFDIVNVGDFFLMQCQQRKNCNDNYSSTRLGLGFTFAYVVGALNCHRSNA